jgi:hypothetical protein
MKSNVIIECHPPCRTAHSVSNVSKCRFLFLRLLLFFPSPPPPQMRHYRGHEEHAKRHNHVEVASLLADVHPHAR